MKGDPMTSPDRAPSEPSAEKQWWVAIRQQAEGPYVTDQVSASLRTGAIPPDAHACLVGTRRWAPLSDWPEFAEVASLAPPPLPPSAELANSHPLTNRRLPSMANWICVYCIALRPVICALGIVAAIMSGGSGVSGHLTAEDVLGLLVFAVPAMATTIAMVLGGVRLRNLRESGPTLIKAAIWASLGCFALAFALSVLLAMTSHNTQQAPNAASATTGAELFVLLVYLLELVFQILGLIWLHRHGKSLPFVAR
jgi:hypothetical protein